MRAPEPVRLATLDPHRAAWEVVELVHARARGDASSLGLVVALAPLHGTQEPKAVQDAMYKAKTYRAARDCADWAVSGKGNPEAISVALRQLQIDVYGVPAADALARTPDPRTMHGIVLVATAARLTLRERRALDAVELAVLASVDERTIRATVKAGHLQPMGPGRPMRFAPDVAVACLVGRSVRGFEVPSTSAK